jgi:hypothetical protein
MKVLNLQIHLLPSMQKFFFLKSCDIFAEALSFILFGVRDVVM